MSSHPWWDEEDDVPHVFAQAGLASATGGASGPAPEPDQEEELGDGLGGQQDLPAVDR